MKYIKLMLIIGASFLITQFSIDNVFLASSPKINPFFAQNLIAKAGSLWSKTGGSLIALIRNNVGFNKNRSTTASSQEKISAQALKIASDLIPINDLNAKVKDALNTTLTKTSQGVYAGEKNGYKVYEVQTNEVEYLEYIFNVNGKEIKIKVPKGEKPPNQEMMETIFQ